MRRSRSTEPKRRSRPTSPPAAVSGRSSAAVVLDNGPTSLFGDFQLSEDYYANSNPNPRSFPHNIKQQCWEKAEKIKGRDPDRWRKDALGNTVFRKLVGCAGCLCHDYDHILPYSKVLLLYFSVWFLVSSTKDWFSVILCGYSASCLSTPLWNLSFDTLSMR